MQKLKAWLVKLLAPLTQVWYWMREHILGKKLDISQINDQLWIGAAITTDADVLDLVAHGVTADIDCRLEFDDKSLIDGYNNLPPTPQLLKDHPQVAYLWDGVADDGQPKPVEWFQTAWTFAKPILEAKGTLLCHCAAGVNRGPSMGAFMLMAHWGLTPDAAKALIQEKRPVAQIGYLDDAAAAIQAIKAPPAPAQP